MIQLSATVFAQYARARNPSILRRTKYRAKRENSIPFKYYRSAIAAIIRYHKRSNDPAVLRDAVQVLEGRFADAHDRPQRARILRNNVRAIQNYAQHFGGRSFLVRALPSLKFSHKNVVVGARPEICATEDGRLKLIRLDMRRKPADGQELRVILDVTYQAASAAALKVRPDDVIVLRLEDGAEIRGERGATGRRADLQQICEEIDERWEAV